jgi:hypothetical protein
MAGLMFPIATAHETNGFDASTHGFLFVLQAMREIQASVQSRALPELSYRSNRLGYFTYVSISHIAAYSEIPIGSERYRQLHTLRSAAERTNSTLKEDYSILRKPPVRSLPRGAAVSQNGRHYHADGSSHPFCP